MDLSLLTLTTVISHICLDRMLDVLGSSNWGDYLSRLIPARTHISKNIDHKSMQHIRKQWWPMKVSVLWQVVASAKNRLGPDQLLVGWTDQDWVWSEHRKVKSPKSDLKFCTMDEQICLWLSRIIFKRTQIYTSYLGKK